MSDSKAAISNTPHLIGYRCMRAADTGVIPLTAYTDPCPDDVPVWSDGHEGERDSGSDRPGGER